MIQPGSSIEVNQLHPGSKIQCDEKFYKKRVLTGQCLKRAEFEIVVVNCGKTTKINVCRNHLPIYKFLQNHLK